MKAGQMAGRIIVADSVTKQQRKEGRQEKKEPGRDWLCRLDSWQEGL